MSFEKGKKFSKTYKSTQHLVRALKRNASWDRKYSPKGEAARELLDLLGEAVITVGGCAAIGAEVGFLIGGPKGAGIGAAVGAGVGAVGCVLIAVWYLLVQHNSDGTITATFAPA